MPRAESLRSAAFGVASPLFPPSGAASIPFRPAAAGVGASCAVAWRRTRGHCVVREGSASCAGAALYAGGVLAWAGGPSSAGVWPVGCEGRSIGRGGRSIGPVGSAGPRSGGGLLG